MITIKENTITVSEYLNIRDQVEWKKLLPEQAEKALEHSLYIVGAYEDDKLIGMGRIVGDGAVICYVQDLIVIPKYQHKQIGSLILSSLIEYTDKLRMNHSEMMLCLMCAKGREPFYIKHGFVARPTEALGPGMIQYLREME